MMMMGECAVYSFLRFIGELTLTPLLLYFSGPDYGLDPGSYVEDTEDGLYEDVDTGVADDSDSEDSPAEADDDEIIEIPRPLTERTSSFLLARSAHLLISPYSRTDSGIDGRGRRHPQ